MTLNSTTKLSIAELAIYAVLLQPTLWLFYKHGKAAISAFFYLIAFEILRIVAGGIQIADRNDAQPSISGAIVSSIGLSPIMLSFAGFIDLVGNYFGGSSRIQHFSLVSRLGIHAGAITGIALVAVGASKLADSTATHSDINTARTLLETGAVILLITWLALAVLCLNLLRILRNELVLGLFMASACGFIGVRAVYSVIYAFDHSPSLSPFTGTFVVKLILIVLVQLLAAISILAAAFLTRNASQKIARQTRSRHNHIESGDGSFPLTATIPK